MHFSAAQADFKYTCSPVPPQSSNTLCPTKITVQCNSRTSNDDRNDYHSSHFLIPLFVPIGRNLRIGIPLAVSRSSSSLLLPSFLPPPGAVGTPFISLLSAGRRHTNASRKASPDRLPAFLCSFFFFFFSTSPNLS